MKFVASFWLAVAILFPAPALFNSPTESKWSVSKGSTPAGTITLLTSPSGTRAEFHPPSGGVVVFLGGNGSVWMRASGGDTDLATISATTTESTTSAALLLPFTPMKTEAVDTKDGKVATYKFRGAKASYTYDAKGPARVDIEGGGGEKYTLTRTSLSASSADASNFAIRPKSSMSARMARLPGGLLGPSDTSVSATAGGRGAGTQGLKLKDGGDYAAVERVENRDAAWKAKLDDALEVFQKSGNVGKLRLGE